MYGRGPSPTVAERFEAFVVERADGWLPKIQRERDLPYPKAVIRDALHAAVASSPNHGERARWTSCLLELERFLSDQELEPYSAALEHERECIRLMGRATLEHRDDRPNGIAPEVLASYARHVEGASPLRTLLERVAAAVERVAQEVQHRPITAG